MADLLKGIISLDGSSLLKTVDQLEKELKQFQDTLKKTTNVAEFNKLNQQIATTQAQIKALNSGAMKGLAAGANQATTSVVNLSRVVQDAPFGFIGIANNIDPLLQSFQQLKAQTGSVGGAFKALGSSLMGGAGLALAVSTVSSLLVVYGDRLFGASKAAKEAKTASDQLKESINGIFSDAAKEAAEAATFVGILKSETETRERKLAAIKELQQIQPEIFANLKLEGDAVVGLDSAYKNYLDNLKTVIAVKIKQAQLEQLIGKLLEKQGVTLTESEKKLKGFQEAFEKSRLATARATGGGEAQSFVESIIGKREKNQKDLNNLQNDINALIGEISELSNGIKVKQVTVKPDKIKIEKPVQPFTGDIFNGEVDILIPPDNETKVKAGEFGQVFYNELKNYFGRKESIDIGLIKAVEDDRIKEAFNKSVQDVIDSGLQNIKIEGLSAIGEAVGTALSGGDLKGVFSNFLNVLGSGIQSIGKQLIALFITAKQVKAALRTVFTNPAAGIIAGVGLVAVGAAIKGIASKGIAGARALGGPVGAGRSYLVGERGPELFTPGVSGNIIPNGRLGSVSNSFGGMQVQGVLTGRGNDLLAIINSTGRSNGRLV